MSEVYEREQRQYALMLDRLDSYRAGRLSLGRLVNDLEGLAAQLEVTPEQWRSAFRIQWGTLEQVHAAALDRGIAEDLPDDFVVLIEEAVDRLRFLIDEVLSPNGSDDVNATR